MAAYRIMLLSTGGTIASAPGQDGRDVAGALTGDHLARQLTLGPDITLDVRSVFQKPSNAMTLPDLCTLAHECQRLIDTAEVDGIVITHGTDTLEDTACFLDTVLDPQRTPIVMTGSQRVPHAMGTDAWTNLQNAIQVAASPVMRGTGVAVVFNEAIYAAAHARKISTFQLNGFDAPGTGWLGLVDQDRVTLLQRPLRLPVLTLPPGTRELPPVDIVTSCLDARPALLDAAVQTGARGIVIEGTGRGHVPPAWMPAIHRAAQAGIPLVVCSSALHGPVRQSYAFAGSLHELELAGAVGVSHVSARKARLRLSVLMAQGPVDRATITQAFTPDYAGQPDQDRRQP